VRSPLQFSRNDSGMAAVLFAVLLIPLVAALGSAVDYSRSNASQAALQAITDSTALALSNPRYTADMMQGSAEQILAAETKSGYAFANPLQVKASLSPDGRSVTVTATTSVKNVFMARFGNDFTIIGATAQAYRAVTGSVELVLVLDTTNSMSMSNKMTTLKAAANAMVDTLTSDPKADVKIGVVPFADYVNVGLSNRSQLWLSGTTDYSAGWSTPERCTDYYPVTRTYNCVKTISTCYNDGVPYSCSSTKCDYEYSSTSVHQCTPASSGTDWYRWLGCVGSRTPTPLRLTDDQPLIPYPGVRIKNPSASTAPCTTALIPLTKNYAAVKATINAMTPKGETYLPSGLVWGLNVLSPDAPFNEGGAYDPANKLPRKVMVFMTDGNNTKSLDSSKQWHTGSSRNEADDTTAKLCANIAKKGIEIYSIALMVDDAAAKTLLQNCASGSDHYFDAVESAALAAVFSQIATSLQTTYLGR
jgi:Flp pilus assembly protein TadG